MTDACTDTVTVIVEIPRGSRSKYKYENEHDPVDGPPSWTPEQLAPTSTDRRGEMRAVSRRLMRR